MEELQKEQRQNLSSELKEKGKKAAVIADGEPPFTSMFNVNRFAHMNLGSDLLRLLL